MMPSPRALPLVLCTLAALAAVPAGAQPLRDRMLAAEDGRAATAAELAPLFEGLRASDPATVRQAVRGLGRLERPALVTRIQPLITHVRADVRAEAVNALGQALAAVSRDPAHADPMPPEAAAVVKALLARLPLERDASVVGVIGETLGRLPFRTAAALQPIDEALAELLPPAEVSRPRAGSEPPGRGVQVASLAGAVKGLETRIRLYQSLSPAGRPLLARLRSAAALGSDPSDADLAFVRRVAWMALNGARAADAALVERGLEDPDTQVRRHAVLALAYADSDARPALLARGLADRSSMVRYEALRVFARTGQAADCAPTRAALADASAHVALAAIDALGDGCPAGPSPVPALADLADTLPSGDGDWHRAAHAFVSLARLSRDEATPRLARFAEHATWQVRMYAARAAAALLASARLERLAVDPHDNVREAALTGLRAVRGHDADGAYIAALARPDYQLVRTAAQALQGSPHAADAVPALLAAFARITAERRDTSRDPRLAIVERLAELGDASHAAALRPCLADADPAVGRACAAALLAWTGTPHDTQTPRRTIAAVARPTHRRVRLAMRRGGVIELQLFADEAPATVARFTGLARQGYYNGLTFHRVVPNFVIQGGSPGANEYVGDGPYLRDELGLRTHGRGTLGISTRGRDTGDAQIFINVADNPRLDHQYTVFAEVTAGMDVVDGILEGDVIERVDVLDAAATQ